MLGSRKLLIVLFSCIVLASVLVVGLSAEEFARDDPLLTPEEHLVLRSVSNPRFLVNYNGVSLFAEWLSTEGYTSSSNLFVLSDLVYRYNVENPSSSIVVSGFYSSGGALYATVDSSSFLFDSSRLIGFDSLDLYGFFRDTVGLSYSDFVIEESNANIFANSIEVAGTAFGIGGTLISFVTSSWVTIVALVAVLLVLGVGVIRKLVKGV